MKDLVALCRGVLGVWRWCSADGQFGSLGCDDLGVPIGISGDRILSHVS